MEKMKYVPIIFLLLLVSCTSTPSGNSSRPVNYGVFNPTRVPAEDLSTLIIQPYVSVDKFNDESVKWDKKYTEKTVQIPSGLHVFNTSYADGRNSSKTALAVTGQLAKGNTYLLKATVSEQMVYYEIVNYNNRQEGEAAPYVQDNDSDMLSAYTRHIINPVSANTGNSIILENNDLILVFQPGSVYALTEKAAEKTSSGLTAFTIDLASANGKVFLYEADTTTVSGKEFRDSNYAGAQTILIPVNCTQKEVTYRYEKPFELQGQELTFAITEVKR